jgi:hypothetical protein
MLKNFHSVTFHITVKQDVSIHLATRYIYCLNAICRCNISSTLHGPTIKISDFSLKKILMSQEIAVGIAIGYGLNDRGAGVRVPVEARILLSHVVQTGSGAHPTSCPMGVGSKAVKLTTLTTPPTSAGVKKMWIYTSTPPYVFIRYCLIS